MSKAAAPKSFNSGKFIFNTAKGFIFVYLIFMTVILGKIIIEGSQVLSFSFLFTGPSQNMTSGGIAPALFGSFALVLLMLIAAVPLGVSSAIYLNEYAKKNLFTSLIKLSIKNLAALPPIVAGLFGLGFFVFFIGRNIDEIFNTGGVFGQPIMLWASLTLSVLVLPIIITSSIEAFNNVPDELRQVSSSMGATKWQTIRHVVLPNAASGIISGSIFAVSRSLGETAPVLFLGAAFFLPELPTTQLCIGSICIPVVNPAEQFMNIAYHIYALSTQSADPVKTMPLQYGSALVLIIIVFSLNLIGEFIRKRFSMTAGKRYEK